MKIYVIGSGAMGSLYGGLLHRAGIDVTLVDIWREHVQAINRNRLHLDGVSADLRIDLKAVVEPKGRGKEDLTLLGEKRALQGSALCPLALSARLRGRGLG